MNGKTKRIIGITLRICLVAAIILTVIFKYNDLVNIDIRSLVSGTSSFFAAAAIVIGIYSLKAAVFVIPASALYLSVGIAFPTAAAVAVSAVGLSAELTIAYLIGLFLGGEAVEKKLSGSKYGEKIIALRDKKTPYILLARALPVFPIDFVSLFLGAAKMNFPKYFLVSFGGIMPRIILFTLLGETALKIIPMKLMMTIVIIAVIAASVYITVRYIRKKDRA